MPTTYRLRHRKRQGKGGSGTPPFKHPWFVLDVDDAARMPYRTPGYWEYDQTSIAPARILAARMPSTDHTFLLLLHELVECYLCMKAGITTEEVDVWDIKFGKDQEAGLHPPHVEPGDSVDAPYWLPHQRATTIEVTMAEFLGVNWQEYEAAIEALALPKVES